MTKDWQTRRYPELPRLPEPGMLLLRVRKPGYVESKLSLRRDQSEDTQVTLVQSPRETGARPLHKPPPTSPKPVPF